MGPKQEPKRGRPRVEGLAERRREEILSAATQVFADKGIRGTDVQEIADVAGIGKGTVYRYFPSKDELFLATVKRVMERLTDVIRLVFEQDLEPESRIRRLTEQFLVFFESNPAFVEVLIQERAEFRKEGRLTFFEYKNTLEEEFRVFDDDLLAADILRHPPRGPEGHVFGQLLYGVVFTMRFAGDEYSTAVLRDATVDLLLSGLLK